ncbi:MAG: InlB B-repeat-containing protein [Firmicutes bacterium]|nr:InlB B-repeat-containing protein [Bacillota bacterium]
MTLNANGGSVSPGQLIRFSGIPIGEFPTPTRAGRSFVGWFNTPATIGGTRFHAGISTPQSNLTLTARWNDPSRHLVRWWPAANSGTTTISYRFVGVTTQWATPINNGIRNWNNQTHRTRVSFQTNSVSNNEVRVATPSNAPANSLGTHVGFSFADNPHRIHRSNIYLHPNAINNFVANPSIDINFNNIVTLVMAHELGHAVGLADVRVTGGNSGSIMDSNLNGITDRNITLSPTNFDITSVNMLYN